MNKIFIIIRREYLTRVRKRSFIVMTLLGPALFSALLLLPVWFATIESDEVMQIAVLDSSQLFIGKIPETARFKFTYAADVKLKDFKQNLSQTEFFGILYVPDYVTYIPQGVEFYSYKQPPAALTMHIANAIEKEIEAGKLRAYQIDNLDNILKAIKTNINVRTFKLQDGGIQKESYGNVYLLVSSISAMLIYMFIFLFGSQVMRGVIEEKTSRIVEIIVSSVKPFQLLMGKVTGVALVGLTQFMAWIVLTVMLVFIVQNIFFSGLAIEAIQQSGSPQIIGSLAGDGMMMQSATAEKAIGILNAVQSINFGVILGCFLFFFVGGYLLYGSLFAAIGSAVDTETDTQQFMLPVTIPLLLALMVMMSAMQNPDGALSVWFSIIPFTSPVVMMARIPFGVPYGEIIISGALLIATFIGAIWLSAKIYRTGILIYGKQLNWRELWKWLLYRN